MGRAARGILATVLALSLTALFVPLAAPAGAVSPLPIVCTAAGTLDVTSGPVLTQWKLVGGGSCQGDLDGTYFLPDLLVQGTSDTIGLCGDNAVVTNLRMSATGTLVNLGAPSKSKTLAGQTWGSPLTTFPFTTPFLITDADGAIGAGTITSRIFGKCPAAGGTPTMSLQFTFLS